jgi:hypothetical protein
MSAKPKPQRDRGWPDTAWSDPGTTKGLPDRWQHRKLDGLHLTIGNNARKPPHYVELVVPDDQTPWKVYAWVPNERAPGQLDLHLVASGTATSPQAARDAAEARARTWEPS